MFRRWLFLIPFTLALFSCGEKKGVQNGAKMISPKNPFLFRMNLMFTENENYISFPIWFEDSIVRAEGLSHIRRSIYHISLNNGDEIDVRELDLREIRDYYFNRNGTIDSLGIRFFYDDHAIGAVKYEFNAAPDKFGYAQKISQSINLPGEVGLNSNELPFKIYNKQRVTSKSVSYSDQQTKQLLHFMFDKSFHGPLSVDSILKPGANDLIVLGNPVHPLKKYSVTNTVHERNVHLYKYVLNGNSIESMTRSEYPFEVKRSVLYDSKSNCIGYIDSTFSDKMYLTRTKSVFTLNKKNLPKILERNKENQDGKKSLVSTEKYEYEWYEK